MFIAPRAAETLVTLLIGATHGTGLLIARRLHCRSPIRVVARNALEAARRLPAGVEVIGGDLTDPKSLVPALEGVHHIVLTAGVRSGRPSTEALVKATEYDGVLNVLSAARRTRFAGRLLYMTSSGVTCPSVSATLLNLYKGNTLHWRRRSEEEIRRSGLDYTIIRAGVLLNRGGRRRAVHVSQEALPLSWRYRIAREDVADAFVASLDHPCVSRATFDLVWAKGPRLESWEALLARVCPDTQ